MALMRLNKTKEAYAVNDICLQDHPDYLYAILNKATQYWLDDETEEAVRMLGGMPLTITRTLPKRNVFHITEVIVYYSFLVRFWVSEDNMAAAKSHLNFLEGLAPDHPQLPELRKLVDIASVKNHVDDRMAYSKKSEERRKNRKKTAATKQPKKKGDEEKKGRST